MKITKLRRNQIAHTWSAQKFREVIQIPATPNSFSRYEVQLKRMPLYQSPSQTVCKFLNTLTSLTESSGTPNSGEYFIDYMPINDSQTFEGSGIITFNVADAGKWIIIEYYEVGTIDLPELYEDKQDSIFNILVRETENADIANTVFSYPVTNSLNPKQQYLFFLTEKNNILKRKFTVIASDLFNSYLTLQDGTNNSLSGVANKWYKTYYYLDSTRKLLTLGTTVANARYLYKSVNDITQSDLGGFTNLSSSMPYFTQGAASVQVGNMVYFFRCSAANATGPFTKAWKIDLDTNTVTVLPDMTDNLTSLWTAIYLNGFIYLVNRGGVIKYDIINNTYTNTTIDLSGLDIYFFAHNETWVENKQGYVQILGHTSDTANNTGFNVLTIDFENSRYKLTQINNDFDGVNRVSRSKLFSKILINENKLELFNTAHKKQNENSKFFISLIENPTGEAYLLTMNGNIKFTDAGSGIIAISIPIISYKIGSTIYSISSALNIGVSNGYYVYINAAGTLSASASIPTGQAVAIICRVISAVAPNGTFDSFGIKNTYPEVKKLHSVYFTGFPVDFD